jgi:hypothetical protein
MEAVFSVRPVPKLYKESALSPQVSPGANSWSQQSEYEVGVRQSPACKDVSQEAEELHPLEAVTKQRDWEH